ncbi:MULTISPECIES: 50S ribosomal protein L29 [Ureaplasma]|uniref:Large ribosomal subunit protein uL29 n=2 Tax=Ureaplasma TaxID=2129 RepID=A0ABT3BNN8_9BACT|nr:MULTISPECIES: 50S ribosomal protein L29 [Ureaplasma]MCV3728406.1 50S ribosomal protein L29 [Ureaplasma miroungigenitalium]MCV3734193.1 50S ribosomal protein L29 [Ureaplasma miroungigenitalium]MCV3753881.1 50S ribosomal protein L29 [Ureaplasma zalophigenitalium]
MSSVAKDLAKKTSAELQKIVTDLKARLLELRFAAANGENEKTHNVKEIRRTIARALTILTEREMTLELQDQGVLTDGKK